MPVSGFYSVFFHPCVSYFFVWYGRLVQLCTGLEVMHILQYKCIETATKLSLRCILSISANNNNEQGFSIRLFAFFGCCFFHTFRICGYDNNLLKCSFQLLTVEYQLFLPQYINSSTRDIVWSWYSSMLHCVPSLLLDTTEPMNRYPIWCILNKTNK